MDIVTDAACAQALHAQALHAQDGRALETLLLAADPRVVRETIARLASPEGHQLLSLMPWGRIPGLDAEGARHLVRLLPVLDEERQVRVGEQLLACPGLERGLVWELATANLRRVSLRALERLGPSLSLAEVQELWHRTRHPTFGLTARSGWQRELLASPAVPLAWLHEALVGMPTLGAGALPTVQVGPPMPDARALPDDPWPFAVPQAAALRADSGPETWAQVLRVLGLRDGLIVTILTEEAGPYGRNVPWLLWVGQQTEVPAPLWHQAVARALGTPHLTADQAWRGLRTLLERPGGRPVLADLLPAIEERLATFGPIEVELQRELLTLPSRAARVSALRLTQARPAPVVEPPVSPIPLRR